MIASPNLVCLRLSCGCHDCLRHFLAADRILRLNVGIGPTEGPGRLRVGANVFAQLTSKVPDGSEHAARNNIAFNLGKPNLDLILTMMNTSA
jgi:hypothetical protein